MYLLRFSALLTLCHIGIPRLSVCTNDRKFSLSDNEDEFIDFDSHSHFKYKEEDYIHEQELPIILWWTNSLFGYIKDSRVHKMTCKNSECLSTANRQYLTDKRTRGIMFYGTELQPDDMPLPRLPQHEWALYHEESPLNNYILCHQSFISLFNHTATFRRQSDFPLTLQFIPDQDYLTRRLPVPLSLKNELKKKENLAPVVYIQSHCEVPSDRDRYVKELMKYISVDSYGQCLNNKQLPLEFLDPASNLENSEFLDFIARYKFHIAIENAFCDDYITEKLMRTLHIGSIAVYKGSPSANDWMPNNHSIILIDEFQSPRDLAEFIKVLDADDEAYESYLTFKKDGITNPRLKEALETREWRVNVPGYPDTGQNFECLVCDKISRRMEAERQGTDLPPKFANRSHLGCNQPYTLLVDPDDIPRDDVWKEIDWIQMYWEAFDHSLVVNEMLANKEQDPRTFRNYLRELYKRRHNL